MQKVWPEKKNKIFKIQVKLYELYGRILTNTGISIPHTIELYGKVLPKGSSLIFITVTKNTKNGRTLLLRKVGSVLPPVSYASPLRLVRLQVSGQYA